MASWSCRLCPLVVLLCLVGEVYAAARQDPVAQARQLCQQAQVLRRQGRLQAALQRLGQAYALVPTPVIQLDRARLYLDLGQPAAARETLRHIEQAGIPLELRQEYNALQRALGIGTAARRQAAEPAPRQQQSPAPLPRQQQSPAPAPRVALRAHTGTAPASVRGVPGWPPRVSARPPVGRQAAKWTLGVTGVLAVIAGATLWALDGTQGCALPPGQE